MTKLHKTTAFLLAAALFLSGCDEQRNSTYQSADTSSDSGIADSTIETSSSAEVIKIDDLEKYSFDFTEDDLRLQSFLRENWDTAFLLVSTYLDGGVLTLGNELNVDDEHKERYFLQHENYDLPYEIIPDIYFGSAGEYLALVDKYFFFDDPKKKVFIPKAEVVDKENNYISFSEDLRVDDPLLAEVNGRLYHVPCTMGTPFVPCSYIAKVIIGADNEVVFSYLCSVYGEVAAGKGVLKKKDGVWKFGWFDISQPMEFLDIHKVWGI